MVAAEVLEEEILPGDRCVLPLVEALDGQRGVVEVLRARRVRYAVVESDRDTVNLLEAERVPVILGDATLESVQRAANVAEAKAFLACLADDAHNVYAILLARQLNPEVTIIARAVEEEAEERLRLAGANQVINPYRLGGMRLALTALKPTVMDFLEASLAGADEDLELAEIRVQGESELVGKSPAMNEIYALIRKISNNRSNVLIT